MIGLASDHAGYEIKQVVKHYLDEMSLEYKDYGCYNTESCDYPDFGHALARGIEDGECEKGIAVCGSGEGIAMTLNKHKTIRAALVWTPEIAELTRQHNDANVLVLPGRYIDKKEVSICVNKFLTTPFEGGRHQRRIDKISI